MNLLDRLQSLFYRKILRRSRDRWNYQYDRGQWEGLHQEHDRFASVVKLLQSKGKVLDILEVGCGDAILFRKLPSQVYCAFTGMDISDVAIRAAKEFETEMVDFMVCDMQHFKATSQYDVVIFNESLYYAKDTLNVLQAFEPALDAGGTFIITAVDNKYTADFWPPIVGKYKTLYTETVHAGEHTWHIKELEGVPQHR